MEGAQSEIVIPEGYDDFICGNDADKGPPACVIERLIIEDQLNTLNAQKGTFKTMFAIAMGLSIVLGKDSFLGLPILKHDPVLLVDFENQQTENARRARLLAVGLGYGGAGIPEGFIYHSLGWGAGMNPDAISRIDDFRHKLKPMPVLTIFDSHLQATGLKHTDEQGIGVFYGQLLRRLGTCLVLDHQKVPVAGQPAPDRSVGSGAKDIYPRSIFSLRHGPRGTVDLRQTKHSGFKEPIKPIRFRVDDGDDPERPSIALRLADEATAAPASVATARRTHILDAIVARGGVAKPEELSLDVSVAEGKNVSEKRIYESLTEMKKKKLVTNDGRGSWSLKQH